MCIPRRVVMPKGVSESYAHITVTLEAFVTSLITNTVSHVFQTSPYICRNSGDNGIRQTARGLSAYVAIHHVSRFVMATSSVAVKPRRADRWP